MASSRYEPDRSAAERRRSQRIFLKVPVIVSNESGLKEHACTWIVNAHGGLMEVSIGIAHTQKIILTNPANQMTRVCKVVRIEESEPSRFLVAFEFETVSPEFWGMDSPPDDWKAAL